MIQTVIIARKMNASTRLYYLFVLVFQDYKTASLHFLLFFIYVLFADVSILRYQ